MQIKTIDRITSAFYDDRRAFVMLQMRLNSRDAFIVQAFNMKRDHDLHDLSLSFSPLEVIQLLSSRQDRED